MSPTRTYGNAYDACRWENADFVKVDKVDLMTWLFYNLGSGSTSFWIGLSDGMKEGRFEFALDRTVLDAASPLWAPGEPNGNRVENCVQLVNGKLNDLNCERTLQYVCEKGRGRQSVGVFSVRHLMCLFCFCNCGCYEFA